MKIGMVGLGKMGSNMARRLIGGGHECVVYDESKMIVQRLSGEGAIGVHQISELVEALPRPRTIWLMVPAGETTEKVAQDLISRLDPEDVLVDGGNSYYRDDVRRARMAASRGIEYMDVGTSGGIWGLERGYCLMAGGSRRSFLQLEPILKTLSPPPGDGYILCGGVGSGHFAKMIHNGIEYGMMQALSEGFDILHHSPDFEFDLGAVAEVWRKGSVISSWLLDLIAIALKEDPKLASYVGYVEDSGEGRWTIQAAVEEGVPADVLASALFRRFRSRQEHSFAEKMLSAMRKQFGGHIERSAS